MRLASSRSFLWELCQRAERLRRSRTGFGDYTSCNSCCPHLLRHVAAQPKVSNRLSPIKQPKTNPLEECGVICALAQRDKEKTCVDFPGEKKSQLPAHRTGWLNLAARSVASPHILLSRRIKMSTLDRKYSPGSNSMYPAQGPRKS